MAAEQRLGQSVMLLWCTLLAVAAPIDRVVAVVADEIVLASDAALIAALRGHDPEELPFWEHDDASVQAALIRAAAGDLAIYQPEPQAIERRVTLIETEMTELEAFRTRWGLDRSGLRTLIRHRMVVEAWLLRNVTVPPTARARFDEETAVLIQRLEQRLRVRRISPIDR